MWGQVTGATVQIASGRIIPMRVGTSNASNFRCRICWDHPHACGDKMNDFIKNINDVGSSPCVWGQVCSRWSFNGNVRIIPMRVGTRTHSCPLSIKKKDHPHACGDKLPCGVSLVKLSGSSPCVWGQDTSQIAQQLSNRIIPMRVGTSCRKADINNLSKDHPHACGDKPLYLLERLHCRGSSPCVWGQAFVTAGISNGIRIIPMRVGTSTRF